MRRILGGIVAILLLSASANAQTQVQTQQSSQENSSQTKEKARPKIGVALEGGGALGLAHIGVLDWFEQHHIPIDYVAGTSMGGLVGGLYATGKSPKELREIVEAQKWDVIIGGSTPYEDLSYRRKEDARAYQNKILIGLKNGPTLPAGLNAGQQIRFLIDHETLTYAQIKSFDDLPIPFRCVATDLVTGKEEVFHEGSLSQALRATMSIPGIFSPVRTDGHVYVDGGLVGNLPTDVVRKMGAEVVIAVHLETAPTKPEEIQSLFSVLGRSIDVVIRENELRGLSGADLVVNVDLKAFNSMDYEKSATIMSKGEEAADAKAKALRPFSVDDSEWNAYVQKREARKLTNVPVPEFVKVEGTNPGAAKHLEDFLGGLAGKPINNEKMDKLLLRLTGIGKFDWVSYRIEQINGKNGLIFTVHEKVYAPPFLQLGFEVDGTETSDVNFTQGGRLTFMDVAGYRSEWRTDLQFGNTYGISTELYRPLTATSKWFLAPHASASNSGFDIYSKSNPVAVYRLDQASVGIDVGYGFDRFTEARFGYELSYLHAKLQLGTPSFSTLRGTTGGVKMAILTDHTDDPVIPRKGYKAQGAFHWYDRGATATEAFPTLDLKLGFFQPISREGSVFVTAEGGSTLGFTKTGLPQYFLGGPSRLSAYGSNELYGDQYYVFRAGYLHDLLTLPPFIGKKVYAIGSYEFGKMYGAPEESGFPNDVALGVLAQTAVGPFFIGGSVGDAGHRKWFFQLGKVF